MMILINIVVIQLSAFVNLEISACSITLLAMDGVRLPNIFEEKNQTNNSKIKGVYGCIDASSTSCYLARFASRCRRTMLECWTVWYLIFLLLLLLFE